MARFNIPLDSALGQVFAELEYQRQQAELAVIRKDPEKHRMTKLMAPGKRANWRYIPAGKNGRGSQVRFCYATNKNAAGYYLIWREIVTKKHIKRDQFGSTPSKKDAIETARRRAKMYKDQ